MTRFRGLLLFLPVPVVLWLFVQQPLGVRSSLALGVVLVATHRLYARPFVERHAAARCLWCGRESASLVPTPVRDPFGEMALGACRAGHASSLRRVIGWTTRYRRPLQAGILGALAVFLVVASAWPARGRMAADLFRLSVALTVVPLGWLAARGADPGEGVLRSPFPIHIQALVGTAAVLWLFRVVGLAWLVLATRGLLA